MRLVAALITICIRLVLSQAAIRQEASAISLRYPAEDFTSILDVRQATGSCTTACFTKIVPQFDCPNIIDCICNNTALQDALKACAVESKCSVAEGLAGEKVQAQTCGWPIRDRTMTFAIVETFLLVLTIIAAILRALARGRPFGGAGYGWDDWTLYLVCLPMLGLTITGYMEQANGLGKDIWELEIPMIENILRLFYIGNTFYSPVIFGTKISFVLLYLRIWKDSDMAFRRVCQAILVFLVVAMVSFEFANIFLCTPIDYAWKALLGKPGHCVNRNPLLYTNSGVNIIMDFVVLLLPIPNLFKLKMGWQKKLGLMATFLVGFAATSTSITQFYYLITKVSSTENPTQDYLDIGLWRITEMYLSVICCCMPMMAGLGRRLVRKAADVISMPTAVSDLWEKTKSLASSGSKSGSGMRSRTDTSANGSGSGIRGKRTRSAQEFEMSAKLETGKSMNTTRGENSPMGGVPLPKDIKWDDIDNAPNTPPTLHLGPRRVQNNIDNSDGQHLLQLVRQSHGYHEIALPEPAKVSDESHRTDESAMDPELYPTKAQRRSRGSIYTEGTEPTIAQDSVRAVRLDSDDSERPLKPHVVDSASVSDADSSVHNTFLLDASTTTTPALRPVSTFRPRELPLRNQRTGPTRLSPPPSEPSSPSENYFPGMVDQRRILDASQATTQSKLSGGSRNIYSPARDGSGARPKQPDRAATNPIASSARDWYPPSPDRTSWTTTDVFTEPNTPWQSSVRESPPYLQGATHPTRQSRRKYSLRPWSEDVGIMYEETPPAAGQYEQRALPEVPAKSGDRGKGKERR